MYETCVEPEVAHHPGQRPALENQAGQILLVAVIKELKHERYRCQQHYNVVAERDVRQ